jgi:hemoglobin-like flavoprotein
VDVTPAEVNLVKLTWSRVVPIKEAAAGLFYGRLFELDPSLKPLFKGDLTEQGAKLMATLNTVVGSLDKLDDVVPVAQALAVRHVGYGVKPEHYDTVGAALLWTLERGLGAGFGADVNKAWTSAYTTLASAMKAAAYQKAA